ncbi:MAG: hypothetical protein KBS75_09290 [Bacteroidales bacterium]|nr:hypothetical protein [Candidatus Equimonas faecalis]
MKTYRIESKRRFGELYNFALQYHEWKREIDAFSPMASPNMDGMPHNPTPSSSVERQAIRCADLQSKINLVESCAKASAADEKLQKAVLMGVTTENCTFNYLKTRGILLYERDAYYIARRKFYWLLDQKLQ